MLRKLTEEAWVLYLKTLDVDRISEGSIGREDRIYRLIDRVYCRYARRRNTLELPHIRALEESIGNPAAHRFFLATKNQS